jgi:hypothetical protein
MYYEGVGFYPISNGYVSAVQARMETTYEKYG